jgi:hypothetical protein
MIKTPYIFLATTLRSKWGTGRNVNTEISFAKKLQALASVCQEEW